MGTQSTVREDGRTNNVLPSLKKKCCSCDLKTIVCLNLNCSFSLSLLQVFRITLVQLVSKQLHRNYMNA